MKNYYEITLPPAALPGDAPIGFIAGGQRHTAPSKKFEQNFCLMRIKSVFSAIGPIFPILSYSKK